MRRILGRLLQSYLLWPRLDDLAGTRLSLVAFAPRRRRGFLWTAPQPRQRNSQAVKDHDEDLVEDIDKSVEIELTKMDEREEEYGRKDDDGDEGCDLGKYWTTEHLY